MAELSNTGKTFKNSIISVVAQVATLILSFVGRKIFVLFLDVEYLGYQSIFGDVFSLLSVADLGLGSIISFHLYKEINRNDENEIGRLMYLYKWMYRIVACLVSVVGVGCCCLIPCYVRDAKVGWEYLLCIYFMQLIGIVSGYFLSYRRTIFIATQQEYRCVRIDLFTAILIQIAQIVSLALFQNYLLYLFLHILTSLVSNLIIARKTSVEYPYLKKRYTISKEYIRSRNMFSDMRDLLIHRISYAIYGGTDNIVLSAFCGVHYVALYSNYVMVNRGVMQVLFYKLLNPVQATIGNIVYSNRSKEELWEQFQMLDVFGFFLGTYIGIGFYTFFQPFIQLWMGKEYLLPDSFVLVFSIAIYIGAVWEIVYKYRCVFGDYKQDRNMMILSAMLNIAISIPGAQLWGATGVELGTFIAFLPISYGRIRFVIKNFFGQSVAKFYLKHICLLLLVSVEAFVCRVLCDTIEISILGLLVRGLIIILIPTIVNCIVFSKNEHYRHMVGYLKQIFLLMNNRFLKNKNREEY